MARLLRRPHEPGSGGWLSMRWEVVEVRNQPTFTCPIGHHHDPVRWARAIESCEVARLQLNPMVQELWALRNTIWLDRFAANETEEFWKGMTESLIGFS